jgi:hypothetical protein
MAQYRAGQREKTQQRKAERKEQVRKAMSDRSFQKGIETVHSKSNVLPIYGDDFPG